jgi:large subunit ribosomal protein L1
MAKKADLIDQATKLGLKFTAKNTISEIEEAIKAAKTPASAKKAVKEEAEVAEPKASDTEAEDVTDKPAVALAKAGKRSEKALAEAKAKAEKEVRKATGDTSSQSPEGEETTKKGPKPITRPLIERRGKKYREVAKLVDKTIVYSLPSALELAVKTNPSKFDASVEVSVRLGVDPKQADQNIRATVTLPNGTGKKVRVAVFAPDTEIEAAKAAGAEVVGDETLLKQLDDQNINFDVLITTPKYMPRLGKYARLLGPKGLMPNPKSGTIATDIAKAVTEAKAGKIEYRVDKQAIVHLSIGKVSFGAKNLEINARSFFDSLRAQKPTGLKGVYVKSTSICTTQGPSIRVENIL